MAAHIAAVLSVHRYKVFVRRERDDAKSLTDVCVVRQMFADQPPRHADSHTGEKAAYDPPDLMGCDVTVSTRGRVLDSNGTLSGIWFFFGLTLECDLSTLNEWGRLGCGFLHWT